MSIIEKLRTMRAFLSGGDSTLTIRPPAIHVGRAARRRTRYGSRSRTPGPRGKAPTPGSSPMFIAIARGKGGLGRRYHQCATRDQALAHHPYMIEHVNAWGQVTRRERLS